MIPMNQLDREIYLASIRRRQRRETVSAAMVFFVTFAVSVGLIIGALIILR